MFIISFYIVAIIYTLLFGTIFQLDFASFNDPLFYILGLLSIVIGFVLSFFTQLFIIWLTGVIRGIKPNEESNFNHYFGNSLLLLGSHLLRVKLVVTGKENIPDSKFVLVGNHQQNSDIILLKPIFAGKKLIFIAKEVLFKTPIIGRWITLLGNIPISKFADRSAAESIVKGIKKIKNGRNMAIFPEGKRSFSNTMIDFKPGAFKLAMKPKADILIVTLYDIAKIKMTIPLKKQRAYVHINGLIKYEEYKDMNSIELAAHVKDIIQKQLDIFQEKYGE